MLIPKIWRLPVITIHTKSEISNLIVALLTDVTVSYVQVHNYSNINSLKVAYFYLICSYTWLANLPLSINNFLSATEFRAISVFVLMTDYEWVDLNFL